MGAGASAKWAIDRPAIASADRTAVGLGRAGGTIGGWARATRAGTL